MCKTCVPWFRSVLQRSKFAYCLLLRKQGAQVFLSSANQCILGLCSGLISQKLRNLHMTELSKAWMHSNIWRHPSMILEVQCNLVLQWKHLEYLLHIHFDSTLYNFSCDCLTQSLANQLVTLLRTNTTSTALHARVSMSTYNFLIFYSGMKHNDFCL